jgi:hypothetical protein
MLTINQEPYQFSELEKEILASPFASYWLKTQVNLSTQRDCLDALKDAQSLAQILEARVDRALQADAKSGRHAGGGGK